MTEQREKLLLNRKEMLEEGKAVMRKFSNFNEKIFVDTIKSLPLKDAVVIHDLSRIAVYGPKWIEYPGKFHRSIHIEYCAPSFSVQVTDKNNDSYTHSLTSKDIFMRVHFNPYEGINKETPFTIEKVYLGSSDLEVLIAETDKDNLHLPPLIIGETNPQMARFAKNKWNFHEADGVKAEDGAFHRSKNEGEEVFIFTKTKDILTDEMLAKLDKTKTVIHKRALLTGKTEEDDKEQYEKELRAKGIIENMKMFTEMEKKKQDK